MKSNPTLAALDLSVRQMFTAPTEAERKAAVPGVLLAHGKLLKSLRTSQSYTPEWALYPYARDFFSQWEKADIARMVQREA